MVDGAARAAVVDLTQPATLLTACEAIGAVHMGIVATGALNSDGLTPEKSLRAVTEDSLAKAFQINTIGPALAVQALARKLPRGERSMIAALSARVGSVSDNCLGGWYGYRASKAALNMIIRCAAIEIARSRPEAVCVGLHPGTVDTRLSEPFQGGVRPDKLFTPAHSASCMLDVLDALTPEQSGRVFAYDGAEIAP